MVSQEILLEEIKKYSDGILLSELSEKLTFRNDGNIGTKIRILRKKKLVRIENVKNNNRSCCMIYPL